jgi:hypothetical protein
MPWLQSFSASSAASCGAKSARKNTSATGSAHTEGVQLHREVFCPGAQLFNPGADPVFVPQGGQSGYLTGPCQGIGVIM